MVAERLSLSQQQGLAIDKTDLLPGDWQNIVQGETTRVIQNRCYGMDE